MDRPEPRTWPGQPLSPAFIDWAGAICCVLILSVSVFRFPFLWDDFDFLGRAGALRLHDLLPDRSIIFYRPVSREMYFWIITHPFGSSPLIAHLLNATVVGGILWMLMAFVRRLAGRVAGLLAGLVFTFSAAVPLAIGWVSASQDLLCTFFLLAALNLQLQRRPFASALAMAAALLSKETAISVLPAVLAIPALSWRGSREISMRSAAAHGFVVVAWVAFHPWTHMILAGPAAAAPTHEYIALRGDTLLPSIVQGVAIVLNLPWLAGSPHWPGHLILPAGIASALTIFLLTRKLASRGSVAAPENTNPTLAILVGSIVLAGPIVLTSLVLGRWSPHYALLPAVGLSMLAGTLLAKAPQPVRIGSLMAFLWLGIGLRGNPIDPIIPTEPNFHETAVALGKVESGFKALHPTLPPSNVYVSVQARGSGGIYRHLFRFQPLRIWYRQPGIWVLDPNRRRPGKGEYLFWIAPDLTVWEIGLKDLAPRGPTQQISLPQYQKTLRGYSLGLAGSGDVERAVYILANMPQQSEAVWAFDRRTAVALLVAAGREADASRLATGVPGFSKGQAEEAVVALLAEPIAGLDLDRAAMVAFGINTNDVSSLRSLLRRFEDAGYKLAARRFAMRLQALVPGDKESADALVRLRDVPSQEITVPIPYDVPQ
jgi:hypothetical protein